MKKFLALLLVILVFLFVVGCSDNSSSGSSIPDTTNPTVSESTVSTQNQEFNIDTSLQIETDNPLTENEVKEIFEPLLKKAIAVHETINNNCGEYYDDPVMINGKNYTLVSDQNLKTIEDVWEYAYSAYTKEAAQRLFALSLDRDFEYARYLEYDGKLYYYTAGHGYVAEFPIDTMKIIKQYRDMIIVSIDYCCYNYEPEDSVFVMCKTENGWRMANSENEATTYLSKQFIN